MTNAAPQVPIQPVEEPIICNPFELPTAHWMYEKDGTAIKVPGRRPGSYYYKTKKVGIAQKDMFAEEERDDLPLVNALRKEVERWREAGYRGATSVTKELLAHWNSPKRGRRLFFCQREAVETIIYLAEIRLPGKSSRTGFKNFELSEENLQKLLKGEKPSFKEALISSDFFPTLIDRPADPGRMPLRRLGCKMATGSGKTVVMSMLIAWAFCNRASTPHSTEFPNAVLVCAPNLTVKERLQVLRPESPDNYYREFDIVPVKYRELMNSGKVLIENWHKFAPESENKEGDKSYKVVQKGPETPETIARRVLGDLYDRMPIMVLNDEGHHCWRPKPAEAALGQDEDFDKEERKYAKQEAEEARVWLEGLDNINNAGFEGKAGIGFVVDLSATPFHIKGSGYPEGQPFPWLVSDFGLVDAIESGIVKIPRLPVQDDAEKKDEVGRPDPKYFRLWKHITEGLKARHKQSNGKPKPEAAYAGAEGALQLLAGQWKERFSYIQAASINQQRVPPVLIVVCDNVEIAQYFYEKISGEREEDSVTAEDVEDVEAGGDEDPTPKKKSKKPKKKVVYGSSAILPEFANTATTKHTIRIDTDLLAKAESEDPGKTRQDIADDLRKLIATVGKRGQPGEHVRCVVSVSMLTEGWDASNVTHILGVRAFGSQLLCEQVVGRGLRRMSYDPAPDPKKPDEPREKWLLPPEYVDVYGIPFSVIPFKGRPVDKKEPEDKPKNRVFALPNRADMEIRFPIVEGYVFGLNKGVVKCPIDDIDVVKIDPKQEPVTTFLRPTAGYLDTDQAAKVPHEFIEQNRDAYYANIHPKAIEFQITQMIIDRLLKAATSGDTKTAKVMRLQSRHLLFPQVLKFVQDFLDRRVDYNGVNRREIGLQRYTMQVVERIAQRIEPDVGEGEPPLLPVLRRYRPFGSTHEVDFLTTRPVTSVERSHLNVVVQHSEWEADAAKVLDESPHVKTFARNDHLGLNIIYEHMGLDHLYEPDFIVQLANDVLLLLEIKGFDIHNPEMIGAKNNSAKKWVQAVNNLGEFGVWDFDICHDIAKLSDVLETRGIQAAA